MPTIFACAVVRDDPPRVFAAEDIDTLHWLVALQLVAATPGAQLPVSAREGLRDALREERWGDAVGLWIEHTGIAVDVYPRSNWLGGGHRAGEARDPVPTPFRFLTCRRCALPSPNSPPASG